MKIPNLVLNVQLQWQPGHCGELSFESIKAAEFRNQYSKQLT